MTSALLSDFPEEETGDAPWFIEPKDGSPRDEFARQLGVIGAVRKLAPAVIVIAIPNARKGTDWERVRRWREGAVAGATDLVFVWNYGTLWAEMKNGRDMPSPQQRAMLNRLHRAGHRCGVYRTAETLLQHLRDAGAPFLGEARAIGDLAQGAVARARMAK